MKKIIIVLCLSLALVGASKAESAATKPDSLIKGVNSSIYYYASDGFRYVFPNDKTFGSWFGDFNNVITVSSDELAKIPLKGNVTYRPGVRMVKIETSPKVYVVDEGGKLRWIKNEALAKKLYGDDWNKKIDDIPDVFFMNYKEGELIEDSKDYAPETVVLSVQTINKDRGIAETASTPKATTGVGSSTTPAAPAVPQPGQGIPATSATPATSTRPVVVATTTPATTTDTTPPPAIITSLTLSMETHGPGDLTFYWLALTNKIGIAGYRIYVTNMQTNVTTSFDKPSNYVGTGSGGYVQGVQYSAYIVSFDAAGNESAPSPTVYATVAQLTKPTNFKATATSPTSVSLTWSASQGIVYRYQIRRFAGINRTQTSVLVLVPATSYTDTTVQPNTKYVYRIEALSVEYYGSEESSISVTTPSATLPVGTLPVSL